MNIFPIEWRVETPKLLEIYEQARDPGWAPSRLPWNTLDVDAFTQDQRYAIGYWFGLLSVFDSSGPAVFARAMIHTYETHEEDPIRKCFFSVTRDEVNHEEVCGRAIQLFTPGGPLGFEPQTALGKLARNNIEWLYHNGARYWDAFKKGVHKYPVPILFTSFLFGEMAAATLFHAMHQRTTIPGAQGGVPLHRPGRGAPSRHLPDDPAEAPADARPRGEKNHHAPAARGLRVPLGRAVRAAAGLLGAAGDLRARRTRCSRRPPAVPASAS